MENKRIDVRILKLNKWYVPKSVALGTLDEPVALGYFDALEVRGLEKGRENDVALGKLHPFTAGYQEIAALKLQQKENVVDFTSQEQMLFLNISEQEETDGTAFTEKEVEAFWNDKGESSPYRYLSMIHIGQNDKLPQTLKRIKEVFQTNYLSYISFDFCDVVLFARNMTIQEYLGNVKKLFVAPDGRPASVFDTFSMVSFWPSYADKMEETENTNKEMKEEKEKKEKKEEKEEDEFQATINISIRDHKRFGDWYNQKIQNNLDAEAVYYDIYGRHDASIVNNKARTPWLMRIMKELHDAENRDMFWTFETYIKIKHDTNTDMVSADSKDIEMLYKQVQEELNREVKAFKEVIDKIDIRGKDRYILPLYEVRDCICSIVKNNFAEEFICCVYESFLHFVSYMKSKMEEWDIKSKEPDSDNYIRWEKEIVQCYEKYFIAMTTLVNSVMHNERQFVQTTAFSAVFYFVPPKIMAFYNAYIYRIKQILIEETRNNKYTFLIYPSFSPIISLEQISLLDKPPCDRILTVTVSEKSLYDIESVMYQMVHELAHYVGSDLRCRGMRTRGIIRSLLKWIANKCRMEYETYQMMEDFFINNPDEQQSDYLQYLFTIGEQIRQMLLNQEACEIIFKEYYRKKVESDETLREEILYNFGIKEECQKAYIAHYIDQFALVKYYHFKEYAAELGKIGNKREYSRYMKLIKSVYRECYADLQMILVLAMNAEDYLNTFLTNQEMRAEDILRSTEDMLRIAAIIRVMTDGGLWNMPDESADENYRTVFAYIDRYNRKIEKYAGKMKTPASCGKEERLSELVREFDFQNGVKLKAYLAKKNIAAVAKETQTAKNEPLADIAEELYEYLLEVLEKSLTEYITEDKAEAIRKLRERISTILDFQDVTKIFSCIEEELRIYKQDGCGIDSFKKI